MTEPGEPGGGLAAPGGGLAAQQAAEAVLTVLRLFRALERVDSGLTPHQYRILKLAGAGGERSARLAERLAVAKPTLTATADGLVAAGYAQRKTEPGDRRVVRLCLTETGRAALERADAAYAGWLGQLLGGTDDAEQILQGLRAIDAGMDERRRARLAEISHGADQAGGGEYGRMPVLPQETVLARGATRSAGRAAGPGPA